MYTAGLLGLLCAVLTRYGGARVSRAAANLSVASGRRGPCSRCMRACIYSMCICVYMYVCIYVCMYIYIYILEEHSSGIPGLL